MSVRFTCPVDASHTAFYARHYESYAHNVDRFGNVRSEANRNSWDSTGYGPVFCDECDRLLGSVTEVVDAYPIDELEEVDDLPGESEEEGAE